MLRSPINLAEKLAKVSELWTPRVVAEMNDYQFKVVKVRGEFGTSTPTLVIAFRDGHVLLRAGEMYVVPKGVEHMTRAANECHVLVVEHRGVVNTGDAGGELTAQNDVWV